MPYSGELAREILYPAGASGLRGDGGLQRALLPVLVPVSWMYQVASNAIRSVRSVDERQPPREATVVSIGNLEAGGGGKTPLALYLLERMTTDGGRPLCLSRGYGSSSSRPGLVTVVPAVGWSGPVPLPDGLRLLRRELPGLAERIGDEGAMMVRRLPGVPMVFSPDKRRALDTALTLFHPTHVVLDDAFQSWGLPRHLDIVLVDGDRPFANGWLLPAGPLRESPEALERAGMVGVNGVSGDGALARVENQIYARTGIRKPVFGVRRSVRFDSPSDESTPATGEPCAVVSAIARPEKFEANVGKSGWPVIVSFRYPDHHRYSRRDMEWILGESDQRGLHRIVTTDKDWAKLSDLDPPPGRFMIARLDLEIFGADPLAVIEKAADLIRGF
jgi:tetraacyldisaccharide 4'-kinase